MGEYRNYGEDFIYDSSNYGKHVSAMTGEQLHSKSDIAAELAYRDDLIEQQQREVESLRSRANTWDRVWGKLRDSQLIKDIGYEHAKYGNCSAASILLEAFELLTEKAEDEQESLAEVRAQQAEESYLIGWDASSSDFNKCVGKKQDLAKQHAKEILRGETDDD